MRGAAAQSHLPSTTFPSLQIPSLRLLPPPNTQTISYSNSSQCKKNHSLRRRTITANAPANSAPTAISPPAVVLPTTEDVVRDFYGGVNRRDLASVAPLIAEDCVYEDLVFSSPFVGRKAIIEFFEKFMGSISEELQFVIDDISDGDSMALGVTWHLEWQGKPFPFSKGCSFYRVEIRGGRKQIIYGRDSVEPATKPGDLTLVIIQGLTWILQRFPKLKF